MIRRKKKDGKVFFVSMLTISGIVILFFLIVNTRGKEIMIFFYETVIIKKGIIDALPADYSLEEVDNIRTEVLEFYEAAGDDIVSEAALMEVSRTIDAILKDEQVVKSEVDLLLDLIRKKREQ